MLLYGGIGLALGGLLVWLFGGRMYKDAERAAKARKQAPWLVVIGVVMIGAAFAVSGMI